MIFFSISLSRALANIPKLMYNSLCPMCRYDGIGRRDGLKIRWWRHRVGSSPTTGTIKSKRYRCHWRKASGINRFRAFSAQKSIDSPIDANRCSPLTGGTRTPIFQRLAKTKPCGALFEAIIFKKGAVFHIQIFYEIEGAVLLVLMTIKAAPFLFFQKSKRAPAQGGK